MVYLDNGATAFPKPERVRRAVAEAMERCANPGRGSHSAAREGAERIFRCREAAGELFHCKPEQVVFTMNCSHGLNMAIRTLVRPGGRVVISGFEHNAVTRPLRGLNAKITVAGTKLFDREETLRAFRQALDKGADAAVFTHVSNVFGYVLPVEEMAAMCRRRGIPFVVDAAQSAGALEIDVEKLGAAFVAVPGHKGLLGPMGTGILICRRLPMPLIMGGTGSESARQDMPNFLPDRGEAGTANVSGIAGLEAGIRIVLEKGAGAIGREERRLVRMTAGILEKLGMEVFQGEDQLGTVSFRCGMDCEDAGEALAGQGIAVRAGLHCAPLAHRSGGTIQTGTVRLSFGPGNGDEDIKTLEKAVMTSLRPRNV